MEKDVNEYIVDGYLFSTKQEAQMAKKEYDAIIYLQKMNNMNNPKVMLQVYEKMISQKLFVTPVGRDYLKSLQRRLYLKYDRKSITPIPVLGSNNITDVSVINSRKKLLEFDDVGNYYKKKIKVFIVVNIMLVTALAFMILLAATTDSAHILNYENTLINRYEHWEQELDEREEELNKKSNNSRL